MSGEYIPELFHAREENLRLNRELRAERDAHHSYKIGVEKEKLLQANATDCDLPHVAALIDGGKPRVDAEGRVVIDFGEENHVGTLDDAMKYWRSKPESYSNIIGYQKPKEPSKRDLHIAKVNKMTFDQLMAYRRQRGKSYLDPEE